MIIKKKDYVEEHVLLLQVIRENTMLKDRILMPRLVYVSREKRPSHPHHFKAGALNVLVIPIILRYASLIHYRIQVFSL